MNLWRGIAVAVLALCTPLAAFADSASFFNKNGTLTATSGVVKVNSTLFQVTGLPGYNSLAPPPLGSVTFTSGALATGSLQTSGTFAGGGTFKITGNTNTGPGGFLFTGMFAPGATWTAEGNNSWVFNGTILNGTLSENHGPAQPIMTAVTTQITFQNGTAGNPFDALNNGTIKISGGNTNFGPNSVAAPELGTLTLLGTGLVGIAILARRRTYRKRTALSVQAS